MELADFSIKTNRAGATEIVVNGEHVEDRVSRIVFEARSGPDPSVIGLEMLPGEALIEGIGVVQVARDLDQRQVVLAFLNAIDEGVLSQTVLDRPSTFTSKDPVMTALDVLKEWAGASAGGT